MVDTEKYILSHIERVRKKIDILISALIKRSICHDKSKLKEPEFSLWKKMDEDLDIHMIVKNTMKK